MPFKTRFVFSVSMDVRPDKEALFNQIYDDEHIPALLKVPGVVSVTRTRQQRASLSLGGVAVEVGKDEPGYTAFVELDSPDVLQGEAWAAAVEAGRWPAEVRPYTHNRHYMMHEVKMVWAPDERLPDLAFPAGSGPCGSRLRSRHQYGRS